MTANDGGCHSSLPSPARMSPRQAASICSPLPSPSVSSRPPWLCCASHVFVSASCLVCLYFLRHNRFGSSADFALLLFEVLLL
ncbi:hypothetical protein AHAS_Ahas14G0192500 [Arachis hypogaea]